MELEIKFNKPTLFQGQINILAKCRIGTHTRTFGAGAFRLANQKRQEVINTLKQEITQRAIEWAKEVVHSAQ